MAFFYANEILPLHPSIGQFRLDRIRFRPCLVLLKFRIHDAWNPVFICFLLNNQLMLPDIKCELVLSIVARPLRGIDKKGGRCRKVSILVQTVFGYQTECTGY